LVNIDKVISKVSIDKSIDLRYFYSSKALYSIEFYKAYSEFISPIIFSVLGKTKKALILDCDNTIWKGIIGEDGAEGVELSVKDKSGNVFEEVHHLAKALAKQGVIVGLCSKNNEEDVEQVFLKRSDMALKSEDITIKKINWADKVTNLREIAADLNIGIESLVFVDDSAFEINFVKENLPDVLSIKVPEKLYEYPAEIRKTYSQFYKKRNTKEDLDRANLYKTDESRKLERAKFSSLDEYLASLQLKVNIFVDSRNLVERTAQLTQKTNQFNFTGHRYTESEISRFIESEKNRVYVFGVTDKFGDYGITGLAIILIQDNKAEIDSFLMSCRIIGRNIENAVLNFILRNLEANGIESVAAKYIQTAKNAQIESFYDKFGFELREKDGKIKEYFLTLKDHTFLDVDYISLNVNP
jgi:FkbH-like protein